MVFFTCTCYLNGCIPLYVRMQHFGQNKEDFAYQVYLFRVATKGKSGGFI